LIRTLVAVVFIGAGLRKLIGSDVVIEAFGRWDVPAPEVMVYVIGAIELVGGLLLAFSILTNLVAGMLAVDMAAAALLAGPDDPLPHLWLPLVLLAACGWIALESHRNRLATRARGR